MRRYLFFSSVLVFVAIILASTIHAQSFEGLGPIPGGSSSRAWGVSADGTVVVGEGILQTGTHAFRWENGIMMPLGFLLEVDKVSAALAIASDSLIIGGFSGAYPISEMHAFRWENGTMTPEEVPAGTQDSKTNRLSPDGSAALGETTYFTGVCPGPEIQCIKIREGFLTIDGVTRLLGHLPGLSQSWALDLSDDATMVVGASFEVINRTIENERPYVWKDGNMTDLGLPFGSKSAVANIISGDGKVIFGFALMPDNTYVTWRLKDGVFEDLGPLGLFDTSFDGSVAVGSGSDAQRRPHAHIWNVKDGSRWLEDVLTDDLGLDLTDWTLVRANAVTPDGNTIVGEGRDLSATQAWRARLISVGSEIVINDTRDLADPDPGDDACDVDAGKPENQCTLRAAIETANARSGRDSVSVKIDGTGLHTIVLGSPLPMLTEPLVLDATTQEGYSGTPRVVLTGSGANGFNLGVGNSTIRGFSIGGFAGAGIDITGPGGNIVEANHLGVNATGMSATPNGVGLRISDSPDNRIGGLVPEQRNVISGNTGQGILISGETSTGNIVAGNHIGTDATGNVALGNALEGVSIRKAPNTTVGGEEAGARNMISGNASHGVLVQGPGADGTIIQGNYIGLNAAGNAALGNGTNDSVLQSGHRGIEVRYAKSVLIGGVTSTPGAAPGNVISGNIGIGIRVEGALNATADFGPADDLQVLGNLIGLAATGTTALPNGNTGLRLEGAVRNAKIGQAGAGNVVVANNNTGIRLIANDDTIGAPDGAHIASNTLGLSATGDEVLADMKIGISFSITGGAVEGGIKDVIIGGASGEGNRIVASSFGIFIVGERSNGTDIASNTVGLLANGDLGREEEGLVGIAALTSNNNIVRANVVGGHLLGVVLGGNENQLTENYIGTNAGGTLARPNTVGILIPGWIEEGNTTIPVGKLNTIGGAGMEEANVISGNKTTGINIGGPFTLSSSSGKREWNAPNIWTLSQQVSARKSGNTSGVASTPDGNIIRFNRIGTNATGTKELGNGRADELKDAGTGIWVQDGVDNRILGNTISGNGVGLAITTGFDFFGEPTNTLVAGNRIGDVTATDKLIGNQFGGIVINASNNNQIIAAPLVEGGDPFGNLFVGNGMSGVRILSGNDLGHYNTVRLASFLKNDGPSIAFFDASGEYPALVPAPPIAIQATASAERVNFRIAPQATGPIDIFVSDNCPNGNAQGAYVFSVEGVANGTGNVQLDYSKLPFSGPGDAAGNYLSATSTTEGETGATSGFSDCFRIALEAVTVETTVAEGETGQVLPGDNGLSVEITENPPPGVPALPSSEEAGVASTFSSSAGTLYAVRYDFAPEESSYEGSAISSDGSTITPNTVASDRYWTLSRDGLEGITYKACLDITGIVAITLPGQLLLVQRGGPGEFWIPFASSLEAGDSQLCASGLTELGDLGIGADRFANPVPVEPEPGQTLPQEFALSAAYPNPFNPTTTFDLDVALPDKFTIEVFDVMGRMVATLYNGRLTAGRHSLVFDAASLPSGIYFVKLMARASGILETRSVSLLK